MLEEQATSIPRLTASVENMAEPTQMCHGHVKVVSADAAENTHHTNWMRHANGHLHKNDLWAEYNADPGTAILVTQGSDLQEILLPNFGQISDQIDPSPLKTSLLMPLRFTLRVCSRHWRARGEAEVAAEVAVEQHQADLLTLPLQPQEED